MTVSNDRSSGHKVSFIQPAELEEVGTAVMKSSMF